MKTEKSCFRSLITKPLTFSLGLMLLVAIIFSARAGVIILAGSGYNIPSNTTTNFTSLAQVGTFTLYPQSIYLTTQNAVGTATNGMQVYGRLTFDGTNFFTLPQVYGNQSTNPLTGALWSVTNLVLPVYGTISVSNGSPNTISNFQAQLQF